jgi:hypothetical protein
MCRMPDGAENYDIGTAVRGTGGSFRKRTAPWIDKNGSCIHRENPRLR